jgi:SAM-dependent methyltransferase
MNGGSARDFYDSADPTRWGRDEMPEQERVTRDWAARAVTLGPSLELGCGRGKLASAAPGHIGLDLAFAPLLAIRGRAVHGDMERLPFRSASIGFLFSWAAIEHVPNPELVFAEVERVLRPGGVALLAPAWHCRPWAAEGLEFRSYSELRPLQKARKALIPFRSSLLWRGPFELPKRIWRELRGCLRVPPFEYERLAPNLTDYVGTDSDAFTSMDPQTAALYFAKRDWEVLSHPTLRARMLARHEPVVVRRPSGMDRP